MTRKNKTWTSAEDSTLISEVKANPQNLKMAFYQASCKLSGRTIGACSNRWYVVLSKNYKKDPNNVCFAVFSKKRYGVNRKNVKEPSTVQANSSVWSSIMNFIKNLV